MSMRIFYIFKNFCFQFLITKLCLRLSKTFHTLSCVYRASYDTFTLSLFLSSPSVPLQSSTEISLYVRFWDSSQRRFRTLHLQCRYVGDGGIKPTIPPFKPQHQIVHTPAVPAPKMQVVCSSQHMNVKLPPVPTSGLAVQGEFEVGSVDEHLCSLNSHDNGASMLVEII